MPMTKTATMAASVLVLGVGLTGAAAAQDTFKVGMAVGGNPCCEWMKAQGDVARALAEQRGWEYVEYSNNNDPAQAVRNAQLFVQEGVDVVIQFNGQPSSNPAVAQVLGAANIPVITYDIAQEGMYFVGIDNLAAGIAGGEGLGRIIKEKWDCNPDLVISAEGAAAGIVNEWRTGGMRTGLKNICPDIPEEKFVSFESQGDAAVGLPAARDLLAAHPDAVRMAVVGLNDGGVLSLIQAAEQLGRADEVIGWGQDGAFITG
ncbi:MAG TPA: sugar ABC transporter substrate-binding protein, partial [Alphaproteobacteria bacterium]|nr:sugar ABC transporter substrate-binding protein [Alphaproteobacteria bacterium]